jgi:hypothetical protein
MIIGKDDMPKGEGDSRWRERRDKVFLVNLVIGGGEHKGRKTFLPLV